jgi:hypothetical protein
MIFKAKQYDLSTISFFKKTMKDLTAEKELTTYPYKKRFEKGVIYL